MFKRISLCLGVIAALAAISCDSMPLTAPTNSTLTIDAQSRVVPTGGSTTVSATVIESSGTPVHNGTVVRFTTSLGRLDPVEAQTRNGVATTTFFAGDDSGVAEVRATSGGAGGATSGGNGNGETPTTPSTSNMVQISVGSAAIDTVTIRANPAVVPSTGGTVTVVATVAGVNGRLLQGIPVTFSATRGTLSSSSAISDTSGNATVTLTTNGDTDITATAGSKTSTAVKVTALVAPAVALTCAVGTATTCSSVLPGQPVTFTARRTSGNIVSSTLDFGDGTSVELGALSGETGIGVPHTYSQTGTYTARLTARDANGETTNAATVVQVVAAAAVDVALSISGLTVTATATPSAPASQYVWTFETGQTQTTTSNTATHTYATAGQKTLTVVVTFVDGRTVTVTRTFTV